MIRGVIITLLTKIKVEKFKSLYEIDIPLKKLNIFIGPNNSGKSSILQTLLFLKQSYRNGSQRFEGVYNFRNFNEIIFDKNIRDSITITLNHRLPETIADDFLVFGYGGYRINTFFRIGNHTRDLIISSKLLHERKFLEDVSGVSDPQNELILYDYSKASRDLCPYFSQLKSKIQQDLIGEVHISSERWLRFKGSILYNQRAKNFPKELKKLKSLNKSFEHLNVFYSDFFDNLTFVPVERGAMSWFTSIIGQMPSDINTNDGGNTLFNALFHMIRREHSSKLDRIKRWTKEFGIHDLTPYPVSHAQPSCGVETLQEYSKEPFQLISMGFGTRQVLYILVKALLAPQNSTILIEEPEIHLHPAFQTKIIDFFIDIINNDQKQVMVTTHSEYLLLKLQNSVLRGEISKDEIGIFYVDIKKGKTSVKELQFTKEGSYEMPGFYDITQQEYKEWLKLKTKNTEG